MEYVCRFCYVTNNLSPILGVYDIEIYDFEFYPVDPPKADIRKVADERISATISDLIEKFFSSPSRVLVYVCDAADGRARERQFLFKQWHRKLAETIHRDELTIDIEDEYMAHGSILTRKDFPHPEILNTELKDKARGIVLAKFDR